MDPRRLLAIALVVGSVLVALPAAPVGADAPPMRAPTMFVLRGSTHGGAHELEVRTSRIEWFTDRPARRAGTMAARTLVRNWKAWGFDHDAPNAALSGNHLDAVVVLSEPRVRDGRVVFVTKPVRGRVPRGELGAVATFVDATAGSPTSTLQIVNDSPEATGACVSVQAPQGGPMPVQSTVWQEQMVFPFQQTELRWDTSLQLMWSPMAYPSPDETFQPSQSLPVASPDMAFLAAENGSYDLVSPTQPTAPNGTVAVLADDLGPASLSLALGISGSPALVTQTLSELMTTFPSSGFTYWLSSCQYGQQGQIVDSVDGPGAVQLNFPPGVSTLTATFGADGNWVVQPAA